MMAPVVPGCRRDCVHLAPSVLLYTWGTPPPAPGPGDLLLPVVPSAAFGDGSHATTRLCAQAVDDWCRRCSPRAALDVGTGTGVLARVARGRGVPFVVGTDKDAVALAAARANAALDRCDGGELIIEDRPPDAWGPCFDLVVANILEAVLLELADSLAAALAPRGALLLSGLTRMQSPAVRAAFLARGLTLDLQADLEGWSLLRLLGPV